MFFREFCIAIFIASEIAKDSEVKIDALKLILNLLVILSSGQKHDAPTALAYDDLLPSVYIFMEFSLSVIKLIVSL